MTPFTLFTPPQMDIANAINLNGIKRATEDMKGGTGKEINGIRYYTFEQAIETAKAQGLTIPTTKDFLDSGFTEERTENNKVLADKLGLTLDGGCFSDGILIDEGDCGYVWSSSEENHTHAWYFVFNEDKGYLSRDYRSNAFAVRPVLKNSSSDISSIGQFSNEELLEEISRRMNTQ